MITRAASGRTDRAEGASEDSCVIPATSRWATSNADTRWLAPTWTVLRSGLPRPSVQPRKETAATCLDQNAGDRWHHPARRFRGVSSASTQLASHRSTNGQVIEG